MPQDEQWLPVLDSADSEGGGAPSASTQFISQFSPRISATIHSRSAHFTFYNAVPKNSATSSFNHFDILQFSPKNSATIRSNPIHLTIHSKNLSNHPPPPQNSAIDRLKLFYILYFIIQSQKHSHHQLEHLHILQFTIQAQKLN